MSTDPLQPLSEYWRERAEQAWARVEELEARLVVVPALVERVVWILDNADDGRYHLSGRDLDQLERLVSPLREQAQGEKT